MAQKGGYRQMIPLLTSVATEMGYEFYDIEFVKEGPGHYLRIFLDKEGGITLNDCEAYHRRVQPELDAIDYDFLEISSPGLDRPLKTDRDFERALGLEVEVKLFKPLAGQKTLSGCLESWEDQNVWIKTQNSEQQIPRSVIASIRPVIHIDDEGEEE